MALKLITTSPVRSGVRQFCLQSFSSVNKKLQALKRSLGSQSTDENLALAKKHLQSLIELRGPLSIATFMQQALVNPSFGYYMVQNVFGEAGDFVTSPEISQMFGELIGVWCVHCWKGLNSPSKLNIIELGPGKGTLMSDLLRSTAVFPGFQEALSIHCVEASPLLRQCQESAFKQLRKNYSLQWHSSIDSLPLDGAPTLVLGQEFLDALPVYQFQYKEDVGWNEILVDANESDGFRLVVSREPTLPSTFAEHYVQQTNYGDPQDGDKIEICPQAQYVIEKFSDRIAQTGGAALFIDYGSFENPRSSVRAVKDHKVVNFLEEPGARDITADVDFGVLSTIASEKDHIQVKPIITQSEFLLRMGILERAGQLAKNVKTEIQAQQILEGYKRLVGTDEGQMGEIYKVFAFGSSNLEYIAGFE